MEDPASGSGPACIFAHGSIASLSVVKCREFLRACLILQARGVVVCDSTCRIFKIWDLHRLGLPVESEYPWWRFLVLNKANNLPAVVVSHSSLCFHLELLEIGLLGLSPHLARHCWGEDKPDKSVTIQGWVANVTCERCFLQKLAKRCALEVRSALAPN